VIIIKINNYYILSFITTVKKYIIGHKLLLML